MVKWIWILENLVCALAFFVCLFDGFLFHICWDLGCVLYPECVVWYKRENKTQIYIPEWTILLFEFCLFVWSWLLLLLLCSNGSIFSTANEEKMHHSMCLCVCVCVPHA